MDYIRTPKGEKYVLRIYNNGLNSKRVLFEHIILDQLMLNNKFDFALPTAIKSIKGKSSGTGNEGVLNSGGLTHVVLSNGAEASLFKFIPGKFTLIIKSTHTCYFLYALCVCVLVCNYHGRMLTSSYLLVAYI